jgi:integrase
LEAVRGSESPFLQYIIPFLLLTGARKSEALQARWEFIDFEARRWMIPLTKNGKPRHVPLSNGAIAVLLATRQLHEKLGITSPPADTRNNSMYVLSILTLPIITDNRNLVLTVNTYRATLGSEQVTIRSALSFGRRKEGTAWAPMKAKPGIPGTQPLVTIGT